MKIKNGEQLKHRNIMNEIVVDLRKCTELRFAI